MFEFGNPQYLKLLWLIPIAIAAFIAWRYIINQRIKKLGKASIVEQLMPKRSTLRPVYKFIVWSLAVISLVFLVSRPRYGVRTEEVKRQGLELVIALDISNSMLAEDIKPNRLTAAKRAINQLIGQLENDRISLIVFAGDAFTQLPMTSDYGAARMFVDMVEPELISNQGTDISTAINRALVSFSNSDVRNKAIIIISDGEDHEDKAIELAQSAVEQGIRIFTLGMGLPEGSPIPIKNRPNDFHRDRQGNTVITRLNEGMLQQLASAGNGAYIRANNQRVGLSNLFDELNKIEKGEVVEKVFAEYEEQFVFIAALSFILLILELLIAERKSQFWQKINPLKIQKRFFKLTYSKNEK
ncbi:MAG: VWA domain-containing protein [Bacteroidales bacterium]|jgi:Ca-activated chloride channel family protein|nr:VWA domain-containing protein [Bacteroidales bacterium]